MKIRKIWVLLVHHDFQLLGSRFMVRVDASGVIDELKDKIKEKKPEALSRVHADPDDITVWKTEGEMIIDDDTTLERLAKILKSINVDDVEAIQRIREHVSLTSLQLPDGQTLLAQLPGLSRISTAVGCVLIQVLQAIGDTLENNQLIGNAIKYQVWKKLLNIKVYSFERRLMGNSRRTISRRMI
jgi:hypothetical protein